jgi:hypothetical protein
VAAGTSRRNFGLAVFESIHCWSVCPSQSLADGDSHGASTGTSFDISSKRLTRMARSGMTSGSGGAVPVGPVSLYVMRSPSAK